ncbi:uncharacterized protein MYCFIDRAFT_88405 [Pseudocercospora fijiensis CIRAD86]|uniref:DUF6604 domain-containing protein n=1 Tax=Pseudocercospora fijiensis (strain CIRAD86) TaxID=383855 RepID=M3AZ26_PSEFD|nr:uncharacterized protein MYCFIDRAFT_88405 [Pseudocercospora fijiensis CIRAD86]EME82467.1 hypothetical protein MYCFIDRAFT_88405 [Pseudocercospora fijiensis CIRAD86]
MAHNNTYKSYKAGTTKVTTWLVDNALRCKAEVDLPSTSPPAAAKAGKPKYIIAVNQYKPMAEAISASTDPKIRVPRAILSLLRDVITLRKRAAQFFKKITATRRRPADEIKNEGHQHFISILEDVLRTLSPGNAAPNASDATELTNLFEALNVEELQSEATEPQAKQKPLVDADCEPEPDDFDHVLAIFAFFEDLQALRKHVQALWLDYRCGNVDIMSAAVTTDTAFNMVKRSCNELISSPEFHAMRQTLPTDMLEAFGLKGSPDYLLLLAFLVDAIGGDPRKVPEWACMSTSSWLANFADVLHPHRVPVLRPGHYGVYEPRRDRTKLSDKEQEREDLIVTMELLPEFVRISRTSAYVPAQDELTAGLRKMMDACKAEALPMYAIFCFEILLDIHHVLREHASRPFSQLQGTAKRVVDTIDEYFRLSRHKFIETWSPQNDEYLRMLSSQAKNWVLSDMLAKVPVSGPGAEVKPQPFHLLKNHPVLAGLMVFNLNLQLQDVGITLCNAWGSVLYPAHLYNAVRQSTDIDLTWKDMEYLLQLHTAKRLFVGAPPTEPSEYHKRFLLALGGSAVNFARNRRAGGRSIIVESKRGPRGLKTTTPVRDAFESRYVRNETAALTRPKLVAMLAVATKAERVAPPSIDLQAFSKEVLAQQHFTAIQTLQIVRESVAGEELHLLFNYFDMHFRGWKLLGTLQTHLHAQMVNYFGSNWIENEYELPYIVGYIFEVVRGSARVAEDLRLQNHGSQLLHKAGDVLSTWLGEELSKNSSSGIMQAKALTSSIVFAYQNGLLESLAQ